MVHWVGEGSNVIICLARDPTTKNKLPTNSSAVFISYDYGDSFDNKTQMFLLGTNESEGYATLDKFYNHPKYNNHVSINSCESQIGLTSSIYPLEIL